MDQNNMNQNNCLIENGVLKGVYNKNITSIIIPEGVTKIESCAFSNCKALKKINIPEGVTEIGNDSFNNCPSLEEVTLPSTLRKIGSYAFKGCKSLKKINIPEGVTEINEYAFNGCLSLEEVTLPSTLTEIGLDAFTECKSLKEINIPEGVTKIGASAFHDCHSLEEVTLPSTLRKIGFYAFQGCKPLKEINIPEGVTEIGLEAFSHCESLKEINIPEGVTEIGYNVFEYCSSLEEITFLITSVGITIYGGLYDACYGLFHASKSLKNINIKFTDYKELNDISNAFKPKNQYKNLCITLIGPKLTILEQMMIKSKLLGMHVNFVEESELERQKETPKEPIPTPAAKKEEEVSENNQISLTNDEEINEVVNKIMAIVNNIVNNKEIIDKVNDLLKEYEKDKEELKPKFDDEREAFGTIETRNIKYLKPILLGKLESILNGLTLKEKAVNFLFNSKKYLKLLELKPDKLTEENNSTEDMIKNIIYLANELDDNKRDKFVNELKEYINTYISKASAEIEKIDDPVLTVNIDYEMELKLNISKLYDQVFKLYEKEKPFKEMLDALKNTTKEEVPKEDSIKSDISKIKYVISKLSNGSYKEKITNTFNNIANKYIILIEEIFKDEERLLKEDYEKIELDFRTEINSLLEELQKYAYLDKYEVENADEINVLEQLSRSIEIIKSEKVIEDTSIYNLQPVTSYIADIHNKIVSNKLIDKATRQQMINKIIAVINESTDEIKNKDTIVTLKDYNNVVMEILKRFSSVELKIDKFICEIEEHKKYDK